MSTIPFGVLWKLDCCARTIRCARNTILRIGKNIAIYTEPRATAVSSPAETSCEQAERFSRSRPGCEKTVRKNWAPGTLQRGGMVMNGLLSLSMSDLVALKEALRSGRIPAPFLARAD